MFDFLKHKKTIPLNEIRTHVIGDEDKKYEPPNSVTNDFSVGSPYIDQKEKFPKPEMEPVQNRMPFQLGNTINDSRPAKEKYDQFTGFNNSLRVPTQINEVVDNTKSGNNFSSNRIIDEIHVLKSEINVLKGQVDDIERILRHIEQRLG